MYYFLNFIGHNTYNGNQGDVDGEEEMIQGIEDSCDSDEVMFLRGGGRVGWGGDGLI